MANVKPIPQGYSTITPSLTFSDAAKAIEFYKKALGATLRGRHDGPDKKILHAELQIGTSIIMLNDEVMGLRSAHGLGGSPVAFYVYVEDADAAFQKATAAGGKQIGPVTEMFWGDRVGQFEDPFGYRWSIATRVKDMSPEEMQKAGDEWMKKQMAGAR